MQLKILKSVSLAPITSFKVGGEAEYFAVITSESELIEAIAYARAHTLPLSVLGGGSNVLISDAGVAGLVVQIAFSHIIDHQEGDDCFVTAGAGVLLDDVVALTVENGWWGIENLSHIPGTVGATPVQNVGAYGVEVADLIQRVRVFDLKNNNYTYLTNEACQFGYRDSVFKKQPGRYIVTEVVYVLSSVATPKLSYKDLQGAFTLAVPSQKEIRNVIIDIRSKKFPDWHSVGTAGSFFKNPIISAEQAKELRCRYEAVPVFPLPDGRVKVALGWILDHVLHLKGVYHGTVGTFSGQALVVVTKAGATAVEIASFAQSIELGVYEATGIRIEWEVTKLGTWK